MQKATHALSNLLEPLSRSARRLGLTDTQWAARSGLRKETLSRLRRRQTCDLATLQALAESVGNRIELIEERAENLTEDGHMPASMNRDYEDLLVAQCRSGNLQAAQWARLGPEFFMAGLAVMLASVQGRDRRQLLALAERLHPGASQPEVFAKWLERSPLKPSRFLPLLDFAPTDEA